jgi:catechol 2,3-dioxygenase-like lactoylglutathione lyase family enzyme
MTTPTAPPPTTDTAPGVLSVSHIAVGVRDMEVALGFYRDVLGLRVTADKIEEFPQAPGLPPAQRRAVYLRWVDGPHASFIVLDQQITNEIRGEPAELFQMGVHHFAFWVDDLAAMMERVHAAGVTVLMGGDPTSRGADTEMYGEAPGGRVHSVFLRDPEGNYVQLDQRA